MTITKNKTCARAARAYVECREARPEITSFHAQLFEALAHATPIRVTRRIAATKANRPLIHAAIDEFWARFGRYPKILAPHFRGTRLVAIEARGDGQVWTTRRAEAALRTRGARQAA